MHDFLPNSVLQRMRREKGDSGTRLLFMHLLLFGPTPFVQFIRWTVDRV